MAAPDYFARKPSYNRSRSGLGVPGATTPASPHTPLLTRSLSSQLTSPGASYRAEEDTLIYELGSRSFRAGFAGDSAPRCIIPFGPDQLRRLNDFTTTSTTQLSENDWAKDWELWDLDIRNMNLGLIEDKIERAIRNAHTNYLMLDQRPRKVFLVLPSALPHPLVSLTLNVVFN
ncbi:fungal-specific actin related protein, partial [Aureobasidium melanogenum]